MSEICPYKREFENKVITQTILKSLKEQGPITRAELLKASEYSLATIYDKYVPRMIEYGLIKETKSPTGRRLLEVVGVEKNKCD